MLTIEKDQARDYLVRYQGLDKRRPKQEVDQLFNRIQTIQYDPLKVVGRNADLVLKARLQDYHPSDLEQWLYQERRLMDGWDKMMNIYQTKHRPAMQPISHRFAGEIAVRTRKQLGDQFETVVTDVKQRLEQGECLKNGQLTKELGISQRGSYWGAHVLDYLFHLGQAQIQTKQSGQKVYQATEPVLNPSSFGDDFLDWYCLRRIKATGLIRPTRSDAWLGYYHFYKDYRTASVKRLLEQDLIRELKINNVSGSWLIPADQVDELQRGWQGDKQVRFIAPLDNFLWDRDLIDQVFDFFYRWEVYVPKDKRQWGYYVLPVLHGSQLIGRVEPVVEQGKMVIQNVWWQPGVQVPEEAYQLEIASFQDYLAK